METANRIILPAMDMNVSEHGEIEQSEIDHYVARAKGGAGLIITGACAIAFPYGAASMKEPGLSDDKFIPGMKALADAIHAAGSKLCIQSTHHGKVARVDTANDRPVLAPNQPDYAYDMSALVDSTPEELGKMGKATAGKQISYKEMTKEDIEWLISTWTDAADRVARAGADAIEIHVAHGYILGVFLNRRDNKRTDEYGGSLENRARLACEVISAVKKRVGDRLAVLVRVSGEEYGQEGGLELHESIAAAKLFEKAGADAIHVTGWGRNPFDNFTDGPLPNTVGAYLDNAAAVKKEVLSRSSPLDVCFLMSLKRRSAKVVLISRRWVASSSPTQTYRTSSRPVRRNSLNRVLTATCASPKTSSMTPRSAPSIQSWVTKSCSR